MAVAALKKNPFVETLQQALMEAGYAARVTGIWDRQTVAALNQFQADSGLAERAYPTAEELALLEISPTGWAAVAKASGAPTDVIAEASAIAKKQIAAATAEEIKQVFQPVSRVGREMYTEPSRVGERVPGTVETTVPTELVPTTTRPVTVTTTTTTTAVPQLKRGMPTWGWVVIGIGGTVVVGGIISAIVWAVRKKD